MIENKVNVIVVDISKVIPNPWNPNRQSDFMFEKELRSIKEQGFLVPIMVREAGIALYEIIDGEHRFKAARELGMTEIPVNNLGVVSDTEAETLTVLMNEIRGRAESGLMSDLMKRLESSMGRERLEEVMPYTKVEFENMLNSADLDLGSLSTSQIGGTGDDEEGWRNVTFRLPEGVADQLENQVKRFKKALHPLDNPKDVSPVQAIEAMCQHLFQMDDDQLL